MSVKVNRECGYHQRRVQANQKSNQKSVQVQFSQSWVSVGVISHVVVGRVPGSKVKECNETLSSGARLGRVYTPSLVNIGSGKEKQQTKINRWVRGMGVYIGEKVGEKANKIWGICRGCPNETSG